MARIIRKKVDRDTYQVRIGCQARGQLHNPDVGIFLRTGRGECAWSLEVKTGPVSIERVLAKAESNAEAGAIPAVVHHDGICWRIFFRCTTGGSIDEPLRAWLAGFKFASSMAARAAAIPCPVCSRDLSERPNKAQLLDRLRQGIARLEGREHPQAESKST